MQSGVDMRNVHYLSTHLPLSSIMFEQAGGLPLFRRQKHALYFIPRINFLMRGNDGQRIGIQA